MRLRLWVRPSAMSTSLSPLQRPPPNPDTYFCVIHHAACSPLPIFRILLKLHSVSKYAFLEYLQPRRGLSPAHSVTVDASGKVCEDISTHLHTDKQSDLQNKVKHAIDILLRPALPLFLCPWGARIRMWPVISSTDHLGGLWQSGRQRTPPVCGWPLPRTPAFIRWKWNRLCCLDRSSRPTEPEQLCHFDLTGGRKRRLVVNSLLANSGLVTLLPGESADWRVASLRNVTFPLRLVAFNGSVRPVNCTELPPANAPSDGFLPTVEGQNRVTPAVVSLKSGTAARLAEQGMNNKQSDCIC